MKQESDTLMKEAQSLPGTVIQPTQEAESLELGAIDAYQAEGKESFAKASRAP